MHAEKEFFQRQKVNFNILPDYGFEQTADGFLYIAPLLNKQFSLQIYIDMNGQVWTKLLDNNANSEYVLHSTTG